jgi:hypothetical protein
MILPTLSLLNGTQCALSRGGAMRPEEVVWRWRGGFPRPLPGHPVGTPTGLICLAIPLGYKDYTPLELWLGQAIQLPSWCRTGQNIVFCEVANKLRHPKRPQPEMRGGDTSRQTGLAK